MEIVEGKYFKGKMVYKEVQKFYLFSHTKGKQIVIQFKWINRLKSVFP